MDFVIFGASQADMYRLVEGSVVDEVAIDLYPCPFRDRSSAFLETWHVSANAIEVGWAILLADDMTRRCPS